MGATSAGLAGCLDYLPQSSPSSDDGDDTGGNGNGNGNGDDGDDTDDASNGNSGETRWPAIDRGEVISDFEDLDQWEAISGEIEAAPDDARTGSQAAAIQSDGSRAAAGLFTDGLNLDEWDASFAIKAESVTRIVVEFIAPSQNESLVTARPIPEGYDGWFRLDCGYEHKPGGEPDMSEVYQINIVVAGPEDGPTRIVVDDLRRTEGVDNGKAILAFYDGLDSHYHAAELLEERGWAGAVPVEPSRIGAGGRMDLNQLRQLSQAGWDVCSYPTADGNLLEMSEDRRRSIIDSARNSLEQRGFADGSRHFFAPNWRQMDPETHEIVRDLHETGFVFGSCPTGAPPTGIHMTPVTWGPALREGVRRHINLCDQYNQLCVFRIPRIVDDDDPEASEMSLDDFEHLLDHIEDRGLDVITPSDLVDGMDGDDGDDEDEDDD